MSPARYQHPLSGPVRSYWPRPRGSRRSRWLAAHHPERVARAMMMNVPHPDVLRGRLLGGNVGQILKSWYMFYFQLPWLPERSFLHAGGRTQFARMASIGRPDAFSADDVPAYTAAWAQPDAARAP